MSPYAAVGAMPVFRQAPGRSLSNKPARRCASIDPGYVVEIALRGPAIKSCLNHLQVQAIR